ncbi:PASTA domain-containing protein [Pseudonocardia oroxyli]|uniref:PASTA domain-containing protein n=1 Tax=Pseudonocardia oroxyli TaxID=366584 RepID=UPI0015A4D473|nr:PASTA domain-containing protein [Pseudonocardia oroxyli]
MLVLGLAASFAGGAVVGWREALRTDSGRAPETVTVAVGSAAAVGGAAVVPDVRGLSRAAAEQALADAGVPLVAVDLAEVPSALLPGTVLRQDPPGGAPFGGTVAVDVAAPGVMPQVGGRLLTEVRAELEQLGAEVLVDFDYADGAPAGTVLAAEPATGLPLTPQVRLRAAQAPASVFLSELVALTGGGSGGKTSLNGSDYDQSVQVGSKAEFLLDRGVQRLTATVGIPDRANADSAATVVVSGDRRELRRVTVGYGRPQPLDVDLTGVLRLTIEVDGDSVVLADPLVLGRPEVLDRLERR